MNASTLPSSAPLATAALNAAHVPPLATRTLTSVQGQRLPTAAPGAAVAIAEALAPAAATTAASVVSSTTATSGSSASSVPSAWSASSAPSSSPSSPLSMARQLGLSVSRIVIDPGHGGHDPGAKGKGGVTEAELVLDVSLRLQKLLEKVQGVEVILTRQTNCFVPLQERTAIANREGADLFLSIHANASANDQAHGVETYFLNFANNLGAAAVAARENAASGQTMGALPDFVKAIALNNKRDESRDFAALVQQTMLERLPRARRERQEPGREAGALPRADWRVDAERARGNLVPDQRDDVKLLKSNAYRQGDRGGALHRGSQIPDVTDAEDGGRSIGGQDWAVGAGGAIVNKAGRAGLRPD